MVGLFALVFIPVLAADSEIAGFERLLVVRGLRLFRLVRALRQGMAGPKM